MEGFWAAICIGILVGGLTYWNGDRDAKWTYSRLQYGEKVCEQYGGLKSFDTGGDFKCKNGLIVQITLEATGKDAAADKTGG